MHPRAPEEGCTRLGSLSQAAGAGVEGSGHKHMREGLATTPLRQLGSRKTSHPYQPRPRESAFFGGARAERCVALNRVREPMRKAHRGERLRTHLPRGRATPAVGETCGCIHPPPPRCDASKIARRRSSLPSDFPAARTAVSGRPGCVKEILARRLQHRRHWRHLATHGSGASGTFVDGSCTLSPTRSNKVIKLDPYQIELCSFVTPQSPSHLSHYICP